MMRKEVRIFLLFLAFFLAGYSLALPGDFSARETSISIQPGEFPVIEEGQENTVNPNAVYLYRAREASEKDGFYQVDEGLYIHVPPFMSPEETIYYYFSGGGK